LAPLTLMLAGGRPAPAVTDDEPSSKSERAPAGRGKPGEGPLARDSELGQPGKIGSGAVGSGAAADDPAGARRGRPGPAAGGA
jgi:hypothetical protein